MHLPVSRAYFFLVDFFGATTVICGAGVFGFGLLFDPMAIHDVLPTAHVCTVGNDNAPSVFGKVSVTVNVPAFGKEPPEKLTIPFVTDPLKPFGPVGASAVTPGGTLMASLVVGDSLQPCSTPNETEIFSPGATLVGFGSMWADAVNADGPTTTNAANKTAVDRLRLERKRPVGQILGAMLRAVRGRKECMTVCRDEVGKSSGNFLNPHNDRSFVMSDSPQNPRQPAMCVAARELISARADGFHEDHTAGSNIRGNGGTREDSTSGMVVDMSPFVIADLDTHMSSCADCQKFERDVVALRGEIRRLEPTLAVDVSTAVMRSIHQMNPISQINPMPEINPMPQLDPMSRPTMRPSMSRPQINNLHINNLHINNGRNARPAIGPSVVIGLLITAFAQMLGALPHLLAVAAGASGHLSSDGAAFEIALAAGFVYAATRPVAVGGVRFLATVLAGLSVFIAAIGAAKANLGFSFETHHVIAIFGTMLLWFLPRTTEGFRGKNPLSGGSRRTFV